MDIKMRRLETGMDAAGRKGAAGRVAADYVLNGPHPLNRVEGEGAFADALLGPLLESFPHAQDRVDILLSGQWANGAWTASTGHVAGIFAAPLWGIPATGHVAFLRYGRFDRWIDGRMVETYLILDLPGLMMQAGVWPMARPLGAFLVPPGPQTHDGVVHEPATDAEGRKSLDLVEAMIAGLMRYDGQSLTSMRMVDFWTRDFWWYGPAPIGSFCGHADYERGHQGPFLTAFPDRKGGDHKCRIGERSYVASTGWPSVRATHTGGGWLGLPPTNLPVTMRIMDFWRRDGDLLAENWVFIDIPELLLQMGVDLFARMRELSPVALRP
ncbi:ester cyclase [Sphingobium algorifonticola]|nr:ester cyclase [Sphingobium algorifonticola]